MASHLGNVQYTWLNNFVLRFCHLLASYSRLKWFTSIFRDICLIWQTSGWETSQEQVRFGGGSHAKKCGIIAVFAGRWQHLVANIQRLKTALEIDSAAIYGQLNCIINVSWICCQTKPKLAIWQPWLGLTEDSINTEFQMWTYIRNWYKTIQYNIIIQKSDVVFLLFI